MTNNIPFYKSFFNKLRIKFSNDTEKEAIEKIVKLISVSLYYDNRVTLEEIKKATDIIDKSFFEDTNFIISLVKSRLNRYVEEFWEYKKDKEEILKEILVDGNWLYADYMVEIFKSDGVSAIEGEIINQLISLVNQRKILLKELGLNI